MAKSKLEKALETLGQDTVKEMDSQDEYALRAAIVEANKAMESATEELEANEKYQEAKAAKSILESGKREVDKRQKAKIYYALHRIRELGKE